MVDVPGGGSGLLVRDYRKEADGLVTRIDPRVVSLFAELRAHERQAAEELTVEALNRPRAVVSPPKYSPPMPRPPTGARGWIARSAGVGATLWQLNAVVCTRVREPQEATFRQRDRPRHQRRNARVPALQKRWDRLRVGLDVILDQRGADMVAVPGGASGLLCRDYKGKEVTTEVHRIDPGVVSLVAELRGHERQAAEELSQWKAHHEARR
jgi:hypothetical protein